MAVDTLSKAFWRSVEQHGEKPALLVKREKQYRPISYTELGRRVYAFARALHELGVRKGDRVAILAENCPNGQSPTGQRCVWARLPYLSTRR